MIVALRIGLTAAALACASAPPQQLRDTRLTAAPVLRGGAVSQLELQRSIQRSTGEFLDGVAEVIESFQRQDGVHRKAALRRGLVYGASALDIATGPEAELNLLDMLVFLALSRSALERHWIPVVLGAEAKPLVAVFTSSERQLWQVSDRILSEAQQTRLRALIADWGTAHADRTRVEWVRFADVATELGDVARDRADATRGLLGGVRGAIQTADRAVMLGERAMFLGHRIPFLLRLQARLGASEVLEDGVRALDDPALRQSTARLGSFMHEASELSRSVEAATREGRLLYREVEPLLQALHMVATSGASVLPDPAIDVAEARELLDSSNRLAERTLRVVSELRLLSDTASGGGPREIVSQLEGLLRRSLLYLLVLGVGWSACFWGGYYFAKRALARRRG